MFLAWLQVSAAGVATVGGGMSITNGATITSAGLRVSGGISLAAGDFRVPTGQLSITASAASSALDALGSGAYTGNVLQGRVAAAVTGTLMNLVEGTSTVMSVTTSSTTLKNNVIISAGGATIGGGLFAQAMPVTGNSLVAGSLSVTTASAITGVDVHASDAAYGGNVIQASVASGTTGTPALLTLKEGANTIFTVSVMIAMYAALRWH